MKKKGVANVTKENPDGTIEEERVEVTEGKDYPEPTCNVGYSGGFTKNIGNYNSYKINVSIHIPCEHQEIEEVYEFAQGWVDERVDTIWDEIEGELNG